MNAYSSPYTAYPHNLLKVSKFQKQISLFSFEPKNERNYFLMSALASKNGSNKKKQDSFFEGGKKNPRFNNK